MSTVVKGRSIDDARAVIRAFKGLMSVHEARLDGEDSNGAGALGDGTDPEVALGDLAALQGVVKFPVRIKCATLSWNALAQGLDEPSPA
jgi:nitrogen fixation NifU-like protein